MTRRIESDKVSRKKTKSWLHKSVLRTGIEDLVSANKIDLKGKSSSAVDDESRFFHEKLESTEICPFMDHRQDLRELGGRFKAEGELWIACMFYATWVEHTLTHLIFIGAGRTGLAEKHGQAGHTRNKHIYQADLAYVAIWFRVYQSDTCKFAVKTVGIPEQF